jgi:bifunctional DNA-binding transcriptional regulator/antitoxin component of YhaV-PrlF toxin-antitoxin module
MLEKITQIDKFGRIVIPAEWRKNLGKRILIKLSNDEIRIRAIKKRGKLTDFVDSIEIDVENFEDTYSLRNKIYG